MVAVTALLSADAADEAACVADASAAPAALPAVVALSAAWPADVCACSDAWPAAVAFLNASDAWRATSSTIASKRRS
ncbi:hypothetical protein FVH34_23040, partial [Salmonella enterica]|nr:hypothetical protein [Salmonella enterica subsp. enterica serovar Newport]ECM0341385.1 hypothetical protein [Salmonella enterica subsp. enterica serovar Newport]EEK6817116.1 hypothetical protein [Salmonella enterica]